MLGVLGRTVKKIEGSRVWRLTLTLRVQVPNNHVLTQNL